MTFDNYKFHCSSLGALMTDPRSGKGLSETCKAELMRCYIKEVYGRTDDIENRYMTKGTMTEEDGITLYSEVTGELFFKNQDVFVNDFIVGTPDIIKGKRVKDIKSCWDIHTFFAKLYKPVDKGYQYQLNGYGDLVPGIDSLGLVYVLVNTPDVLIEQEKSKLKYKMGIIDPDANPEYLKACEEIDLNSIYNDIDKKKRYMEFTVDKVSMATVYERVKECRNFLNSLI